MNDDVKKFSDGLDEMLRREHGQSGNTGHLVDQFGFAINEELRKVEAVMEAIDRRDAIYRKLIDRVERPRPTPTALSDDRRETLASGITENLPRIMRRSGIDQVPPPIPPAQEYSGQQDERPRRSVGAGRFDRF